MALATKEVGKGNLSPLTATCLVCICKQIITVYSPGGADESPVMHSNCADGRLPVSPDWRNEFRNAR